ncbi:toxin-antitoxin system YwqK family antitoxin [Anatilimnocola floriformis]|uniref:toxin-antitoxin system YwqK family antitoxin n=1 Tax=Anatilimnocola floriformis TaxID=2948575 RepID=UPI0020C3D222|nr:hypothetical protein [Anatilimnocola floriformis]
MTTSTYRRGWNGKPQLNGVRQYWRLPNPDAITEKATSPVLVVEKHYVDNDLRRVTFLDVETGETVYSKGYLNGLPHGKSTGGAYHNGKRVGIWHEIPYYAGTEEISVQKSYRDGYLHGEWIWKGAGGRTLQTAKYDDGRLIEWNGLPTKQAIELLLRKCELDDADFSRLQRPAACVELISQPSLDNSTKRGQPRTNRWQLHVDGQRTNLTLAERVLDPFDFFPPHRNITNFLPGDPIIESLLATCLNSNETLVLREHTLYFVEISSAELIP